MSVFPLANLFFTSFVVGLSGAMVPGPVLALTIAESAKKGALAGVLIIIGHAFLELILFVGFVLGLQRLLKNDVVIRTVGIFGGLFLFWMAYGMLRNIYKDGQFLMKANSKDSPVKLSPFFAGVAVSLANPYWTLWWATVGAKFVLESLKYGKAGLSFFYTGHILSDFLWYGVVILAVASGRKLMSGRVYRYLIGICAIFLIALAVLFIFDIKVF